MNCDKHPVKIDRALFELLQELIKLHGDEYFTVTITKKKGDESDDSTTIVYENEYFH